MTLVSIPLDISGAAFSPSSSNFDSSVLGNNFGELMGELSSFVMDLRKLAA
jgi:hypothetical protein